MTTDQFLYEVGQRVIIVTDMSRSGYVTARRMHENTATQEYLILRDYDGAEEWFPHFALASIAASREGASRNQSTHIHAAKQATPIIKRGPFMRLIDRIKQ